MPSMIQTWIEIHAFSACAHLMWQVDICSDTGTHQVQIKNTWDFNQHTSYKAVSGEAPSWWGWISSPSMRNRRTQGLVSQLKEDHKFLDTNVFQRFWYTTNHYLHNLGNISQPEAIVFLPHPRIRGLILDDEVILRGRGGWIWGQGLYGLPGFSGPRFW